MSRRIPVLLALLFSMSAMADEVDMPAKGTFSILFENDLFGGTDVNYTNGIKFSWVSRDLTKYRDSERLPKWLLPVVRKLPFINEPGLQRNVGLGFGQNIFTPNNIQQKEKIDNDRPYAAWLYTSAAFHNKNEQHLNTMEIQLGMVGPAALGEQVQNTVHRLQDIDLARGWDNQLKNELAFAFIYEHKDRYLKRDQDSKIGADFITHYGGALGTVFTYLNAGVETRLGWNLPADFGTSLIRPGGEANAPLDSSDPRLNVKTRFSLYGFAAASGRFVLRDLFLDGNTFTESHEVKKEHWVGDLIVGVGFVRRGWKLTYSQVFRTREFRHQPHHHNFGSLSISRTL